MGVMGVVVDGCEESLVGTIGMIGTGAACELVSWSFAGSGVAGGVEAPGTVETLETGAVCESTSWSCSGSGAAGLVGTIGTGVSGGVSCAAVCGGSPGTVATIGTGVSASGVPGWAAAGFARQGGPRVV